MAAEATAAEAEAGAATAEATAAEAEAGAGGLEGGTTDLYRVSPIARGSSELDNGLNSEHFPLTDELDGSAHFGNEARVNDYAANHGGTHGQGFRVTVPNKWLTDSNIEIWEDMTPDLLEYIIPRNLFDEFNQFPRTPWVPGGSS